MTSRTFGRAVYDAETFRFIRNAENVEFNSLTLPPDAADKPLDIVRVTGSP